MTPARTIGLAAALWVGAAGADSWAPPPTTPQTYASANKKFRFVVAPGERGRNAVPTTGKMLDAKGAELWSVTLVNRTLPLAVLPSDDGHFVATFDDYGSSGGPNALVLYKDGRKLVHLSLDALVTQREARKLPMSVSSIWWRASERFDLAQRKLVVGIAVGGNRRPTEGPGPTVERRIDLDTGGVLGLPDEGPPPTAASLLEELKTTTDRGQVLADLAADFSEDPAVQALWRTLAFDEKAAPGERSQALSQLGKRLTADDLAKLTPLIADPAGPMAGHVLGLVVDRNYVAALPTVLAACKQPFDKDRGYQKNQYLTAALKLSDHGPEAVALGLEHGDPYLKGTILEKLNVTDPPQARKLALAMLVAPEAPMRELAEKVLVQSLDPKDAARLAASTADLTKRAMDPGSPVGRAPQLTMALAALAVDQNRLDDAAALYGKDPRPSALVQLAHVEALRGNAAACIAAGKKLAKLPKDERVCSVAHRPQASFGLKYGWRCDERRSEEVVEQLAAVCGGPLKAQLQFEMRGSVIDLTGTLENTTKADLEPSATLVDIRWAHRGVEVERTTCSQKKLAVPKKTQVVLTCPRVKLPTSVEGTREWPLRADVEVQLLFKDPKQKPMRARTTAFLVR